MGLAPDDVGGMSLYQLSAYVAGWNRAQGDGRPEAPTDDEFERMLMASAEMDLRLSL